MVDFEAQVNASHRRPGPVSGFASQAAKLCGDALELAELQAKLAKEDAIKVTRDSTRPIAILIAGACGLIASLPVLTLGLASMCEALTALNAWQSKLLLGSVVAIVSFGLIYLAIGQLRKSLLQFRRSAEELAKNVAWAKIVVRSAGESQPQAKH